MSGSPEESSNLAASNGYGQPQSDDGQVKPVNSESATHLADLLPYIESTDEPENADFGERGRPDRIRWRPADGIIPPKSQPSSSSVLRSKVVSTGNARGRRSGAQL